MAELKKEKIGWGILGPGRIGEEFAASLAYVPDAFVAAAGSRDLAKCQAFCKKFGGKAYGSYEELVQDPDVDIIYVATPHPMHQEHVMLAARAGKAVLCEKPFTVGKRQAQEMFDCAKQNGVFLMEGLWSRFFPAWRYVRERIASGELGRVVSINASTGWGLQRGEVSPSNRLLDPALAGGALLDGGVYGLSAMTVALGRYEQPRALHSVMQFAPTGVDEETTILLEFEDGVTATLMCGLYRKEFEANIICEKGMITLPRHRNPDTVLIKTNPTLCEVETLWDEQKVRFPYESFGFQYEAAAVQACLREGRTICPEVTPEETLLIAEICDRVRAAGGLRYPFEGNNTALR